MPKKVERCVEKLKEQGFTEDEAWAICKDRLDDAEMGAVFAMRDMRMSGFADNLSEDGVFLLDSVVERRPSAVESVLKEMFTS